MTDTESLRQTNKDLINKLQQNQRQCRLLLSKSKENRHPSIMTSTRDNKNPTTSSRKRISHDLSLVRSVSPKRPRKPNSALNTPNSPAKAREALNRRSFSGQRKNKLKRRTTSTPLGTPAKVTKLPSVKTPQSILKRRQIIEKNIQVDSRLSDRSLCITPDANKSDYLNFSYDVSSVHSPRSTRSSTRKKNVRKSTDTSGEAACTTREEVEATRKDDLLYQDGNSRSAVMYQKDKTRRGGYLYSVESTKKAGNRVTFNDSLSRTYSTLYDRDREQVGAPMLGYDWIAGALDNSRPSAVDKSDAYFDEILSFRKENKDSCVSRSSAQSEDPVDGGSSTMSSDSSSLIGVADHTCIHTYVIDQRLYAQPLNRTADGQSACPVCRKPKKDPTSVSPAYVRVSMPRRHLEEAYTIKPHRRRSFDPSDSCALSEHCLAGMQSSRPSSMRAANSLDMKSAVVKGVRSKFVVDNDVDKIIREEKLHYREPTRLTRSRVLAQDLRSAHSKLNHAPHYAGAPSSKHAPLTRREGAGAKARVGELQGAQRLSKRTADLLDTSYALRHQAQRLERKAHAQPAGNTTRYPVGC